MAPQMICNSRKVAACEKRWACDERQVRTLWLWLHERTHLVRSLQTAFKQFLALMGASGDAKSGTLADQEQCNEQQRRGHRSKGSAPSHHIETLKIALNRGLDNRGRMMAVFPLVGTHRDSVLEGATSEMHVTSAEILTKFASSSIEVR